MDTLKLVPRVVGAVIAVLLQLIAAPNIAVIGVVPNFVLAYVLALAVARPGQDGPLLAFFCGLVFDLLGSGPVGGMAFCLTLVSFIASRAFSALNNDTLFMSLAVLIAATLAVEAIYACFMLAFGAASGIVEAFVYRMLPATLLDGVLAVVAYPIVLRFCTGSSQQPGKPRLR